MPLSPAVLLLAAVPRLTAMRADKPPVLDGKLDDPVWQRAPSSDVFTQKTPVDGKPPGDRTVVRILYDDDNVYIGIDCPQTAEVVARLTRRDRAVEADSVTVVLDTRADGKSAFEFSVNAAGVLSDGLHYNDTDFNQDWDENWDGVAAITSTGWSAELRIPLRALRFPALPVQSWGLQVRRYVSARQETDEWAHIPRDEAGEVSRYGHLDALEGLRSRTPIELRPFVVGTIRHNDPLGYNLARGWAPGISAGVDLKWHVSQSLTLDATLLPDFGQVEADQVILNLTNYELFYPEKRPFFLEGVDAFTTPIQLLYTRRIGAAPDSPALVTTLPQAEQLVDNPVPSTIYGAAKLTGDLGGRWTIAELVALTGRETVSVQPLAARPTDRTIAPYTAFEVLRLKREIGANSSAGVMFTGVGHVESGHDYPALPAGWASSYPIAPGAPGKALALCPNGDTTALGTRCFHDAYVAGVDGRWRSESGEYTVTGQAIGSLVENGPPHLLPDGTVVNPGDKGAAVNLHAAKEGGKNYVGALDFEGYSRKVDYDDLGFQLRQNLVKEHANFEYRILEPRGPMLETHTWVDFTEQDNLDGLNQGRSLSVDNYTKFKNTWQLYTELHVRPRHFDDREMGDGAALERGALVCFEVWLATDTRKRVSAGLWTQAHFIENGFGYQGEGQVSLKVLPQWDVDLLPTWVYAVGEPRFFGFQGSSYLFGHQRAQSLSLTLRSTYTFTPTLTLQAYVQAIVESEHFSDFASSPALGAGDRVHLSDLRPYHLAVWQNPDFESGTINASLVARWEYRLGSTVYLVYTHSQNDTVIPSFGAGAGFDFARIAPRPANDALLLKVSYWWG